MQIKRIIFIRSGETDWNRIGRWQGWVASPLNDHGVRQVTKLASFLRNIGIGAIYSSDLQRARDTVNVILNVIDVPVHYESRLRERSIGGWQGMNVDELKAWYPQQFEALQNDKENYRIEGGESLADVYERMKAAFDDILKQDAAETIAIISHTASSRRLLTGLISEFDYEQKIRNSSVTTIRYDEASRTWKLVATDDIEHLEGIETQSVVDAGE